MTGFHGMQGCGVRRIAIPPLQPLPAGDDGTIRRRDGRAARPASGLPRGVLLPSAGRHEGEVGNASDARADFPRGTIAVGVLYAALIVGLLLVRREGGQIVRRRPVLSSCCGLRWEPRCCAFPVTRRWCVSRSARPFPSTPIEDRGHGRGNSPAPASGAPIRPWRIEAATSTGSIRTDHSVLAWRGRHCGAHAPRARRLPVHW